MFRIHIQRSSSLYFLDVSRNLYLAQTVFGRLVRSKISQHEILGYRRNKRTLSPRTSSFLLPSGERSFKQTFARCGLFTFVSINAIFAVSIVWNYENWKFQVSKHQKRRLRETVSAVPFLLNPFLAVSFNFLLQLLNYFTAIFGRPPKSSDVFWGKLLDSS